MKTIVVGSGLTGLTAAYLVRAGHQVSVYEQFDEIGEVRPALGRAFASDRPAVIEVLVERSYPLSGSPAVGWWDVPVPAYLTEPRAKYERERGEEQ